MLPPRAIAVTATTVCGSAAAARSASAAAALARSAFALRREPAARALLYAAFCSSHAALRITLSGGCPSRSAVPPIRSGAAAAAASVSNSTKAKPSASRLCDGPDRGSETHVTAPHTPNASRSMSMVTPAGSCSTYTVRAAEVSSSGRGETRRTDCSSSETTSPGACRSAATITPTSCVWAATRLKVASVSMGTAPVPSAPVRRMRKRSRRRLESEK
mmetsp:Transcript_30665/g.97849  ORF Transcript_30665/g.97849 Transcript_30665/m.97849 type:complete len:217 (-) Transcript_30665:141-791(-)